MKTVRVLLAVFAFLIAYALAYWLVMDRSLPAFDGNGYVSTGSIRFRSAARFAAHQRHYGGYSFYNDRRVTIWNFLFAPADAVYFSISDGIGKTEKPPPNEPSYVVQRRNWYDELRLR